MFAALAGYGGHPGVYGWICHWGFGEGAERKAYADFLDEAAAILDKPKLRPAADLFRSSGEVWCELANAALPDDVPMFKETRDLLNRRRSLFLEKGDEALKEIKRANDRLNQIRAEVAEDSPLSDEEAAALRQRMSEHVLKIHDIEYEAIDAMQAAVA
jgi:hypothetical protein